MTIMTSRRISHGVGSTKSEAMQQVGAAIFYHLLKALSPLPGPDRMPRAGSTPVRVGLSVVQSLLITVQTPVGYLLATMGNSRHLHPTHMHHHLWPSCN